MLPGPARCVSALLNNPGVRNWFSVPAAPCSGSSRVWWSSAGCLPRHWVLSWPCWAQPSGLISSRSTGPSPRLRTCSGFWPVWAGNSLARWCCCSASALSYWARAAVSARSRKLWRRRRTPHWWMPCWPSRASSAKARLSRPVCWTPTTWSVNVASRSCRRTQLLITKTRGSTLLIPQVTPISAVKLSACLGWWMAAC